MKTFLSGLLVVWWHLQQPVYAVELQEHSLNTPATRISNGSYVNVQNGDNATTVEDHLITTTPLPNFGLVSTTPRSPRQNRQLFYDPGLLLLTNFGSEGSKCINSYGTAGVCVRLSGCQSFYRHKRQFTFFTLRQWAQTVTSQLPPEICSFYDQFGRANSGICCTAMFPPGNGFDMLPTFLIPGAAVNPLPAPPTQETPSIQQPVSITPPPAMDSDSTADNSTIEVLSAATFLPEDELPTTGPQFHDENNVIYDPIKDDDGDEDKNAVPSPTFTATYQWPSQFAGHFGTGIHQWPPPLPTHPPSAASWPPPIPTHPPNHHYPTHPGASGVTRPTKTPPASTITTRRPSSTTTTRRTTTTTTTTTTRRPSYPSYPGFPGYPGYPSYPTHRPTSSPTTTTRRPPATAQPGSSSGLLPAQCGVKSAESRDQERIVGGNNASPNEFPWIAVLFKGGKQFCGGSMITPNHILTAAHCVARMTSWDVAALTAHLGDYNIRTDYEAKHVVRRIKRLVRHKGFDFSTLHNDIAILTVNEPVKFTREIQPICLPTSNSQQGRSYSGQLATVAGWGSLRENGPQPSILQKVQIPIWSNIECARKYGRAAPAGIIESMLCAGQASKDSCSGDSGGPLIVNDGGRYTQVGIVSWGIGCGKGEYPGVYTRVTSLLPWIYKNIK